MEQTQEIYRPSDRVSWRAVNGVRSGILDWDMGGGNWMVRLDNGKSVIVNENSFVR